jgi:hypothetical protein
LEVEGRSRGGGEQRVRYQCLGYLRGKDGKVYINGIEGFWSYAKERLLKFHGVSRKYFVYYLKALEFRYNFRANLDEMLYNVLGGIK